MSDQFQSSAAPKGGCNAQGYRALMDLGQFQSSAAPKGGCNQGTRPPAGTVIEFQSSAAPKGGCNPELALLDATREAVFQSSAAPKGGCNGPLLLGGEGGAEVSILSRPEGRLQRRSLCHA